MYIHEFSVGQYVKSSESGSIYRIKEIMNGSVYGEFICGPASCNTGGDLLPLLQRIMVPCPPEEYDQDVQIQPGEGRSS